MDYRYYRGDGPQLPSKWTKHIHKLRYIGTVMMFVGILLIWMMVLHIVKSIFIWNFLSWAFLLIGMISVIIGVAWDNLVDRSD